MKEFNTDILEVPRNKILKRGILKAVLVSVIGIVISYIFLEYQIPIICLALFIACSSFAINNPVQYAVAKLSISEHTIAIGDDSFEISSLKDIRLIVTTYNGQGNNIDSETYDGTDNEISFIHNEVKYRHDFFIKSYEHKQELLEVVTKWYENKIVFYEGDKAGRTYCNEPISYKKFQELKSYYGVSKW